MKFSVMNPSFPWRQNDIIHANYFYFYTLIPISSLTIQILNDFKLTRNKFLKIEIKCKCLLWVSNPNHKKWCKFCLIEGIFDQGNDGDWELCKSMLKEIVQDSCMKTGEMLEKMTFVLKDIHQMPTFSHFFQTNKTINQSVIRREFIQRKLVNGIKNFCSKIEFTIAQAEIANKAFVKHFKGHKSKSKKSHVLAEEETRKKPTKSYSAKSILNKVRRMKVVKDADKVLKAEEESSKPKKFNFTNLTDKYYNSAIEEVYLKVPEVKIDGKRLRTIQFVKEYIESIKGDDINDIFMENVESEYKMQAYESGLSTICNKNILKSKEFLTYSENVQKIENKLSILVQERNAKEEVTEIYPETFLSLQEDEISLQSLNINTLSSDKTTEFGTGKSFSHKKKLKHKEKFKVIEERKNSSELLSRKMASIISSLESSQSSKNQITEYEEIIKSADETKAHSETYKDNFANFISVLAASSKINGDVDQQFSMDDHNEPEKSESIPKEDDGNPIQTQKSPKNIIEEFSNVYNVTASGSPVDIIENPNKTIHNIRVKGTSGEEKSKSDTEEYIKEPASITDINISLDVNMENKQNEKKSHSERSEEVLNEMKRN